MSVSAKGPAAGDGGGHNSVEPDRVSDWFTEDFRLHEPGVPFLPVGHEGASQMRARFKTLTPPMNLEILDMIEEGESRRRALAVDGQLRRQAL